MHALGLDLGGTKVEAALLDDAGRTLWKHRVATPAGDYAATVHSVAALVAAARQAADGPFTIGIGTPGTATAAGLMKNCNSTCLNGRPLRADLQAAVGQPVVLMNDANCLALSEATDGAGAGAAVVFAAILGTGTGAGIAVNGQVLGGPNGLAGEWGHNPLPWADADEREQAAHFSCYCGQHGCIEAMVCGPALARLHGHMHGHMYQHIHGHIHGRLHPQAQGGALDAAAIAGRAAAGDADCRATLDQHAHRLARALASVINLLDPDVIVLGGGLSLMPHLYEQVPALWSRWVFSAGADAPVRTRLLPALHGDASGVRGAAWVGRSAPR